MAMQSSNLLPALQELPGGESAQHRSFRDIITDVVNMDRAMYAAEFASSVSAGMWFIFEDINVPDKYSAAFKAQFTRISEEKTLHEYAQEKMAEGPEAFKQFIDQFKGKVAEFDTAEQLREAGWTNVQIAPNPNQPVLDITGTPPGGGEPVLWQSKTGGESYASSVQHDMVENPDVNFALSSKIFDRIAESNPEATNRLMDIGSDYERVRGITDGLSTLSANNGIDIPDSIGDMLPYVAEILAGARLIYSVIKTEREFAAADRTTKNKIQVVQSLTVMSRFGVSSVLAAAGGMGGTAIGTAVPGVGNLVGGIGGTLAGAGVGMYLNRHLQPRMLDLALGITGLTNDDLFYYKNKPRIDEVALNFRRTAGELATHA